MIGFSVQSPSKGMVKSQNEDRIVKLKQSFKQPTVTLLQNAEIKSYLSDLHSRNVFVAADQAPNNIITICEKYYIVTMIKELGLDSNSAPTKNWTYAPCQLFSKDIICTHEAHTFVGTELSDDDKRLPDQ